jgi:NAD(P)-dependent dehydrogenase (short-subunit alcohol dehydrogenase family)
MAERLLKTLAISAGVVAGAGLIARTLIRRARHMDLAGRVVLVTGGSRGLGLNIAREAVKRRARVAICARDEVELYTARDELIRRGGDVLAVQCDVTVPAQVSGMIEGVLNHFGGIDVLINNAGIISVGPLDSLTLDDFERAMQTHFSAPLYTTFAVLPHMRLRGSGRIVNISSIGGRVAVPHLIPYCASKFALVGLSESLRAELTREGIYVTTVAPGLIRTGSTRHVDVKGQHEKEYAWFVSADVSPLLSMEPSRLAGKILDAASTGQVELVMPFTAKVGVKLHGIFPSLTSELSSLVNMLLPDAGGIGTQSVKGGESDSRMVPPAVRRRNMEAAMENNQFSGEVGF